MVLLFSGGIDSYVAYFYLDKPKTVYFNVGSRYSKIETTHVLNLIASTTIETSLYLGDRETASAYIPFRNLLLALQAVKYSDTIVIAGLKDDMVSDKNEAIFTKFSKIMSEMEGRSINVISPFWGMTKFDVVQWYQNNVNSSGENDKTKMYTGQSLLNTISCYSGTEQFCGKCPACFRKWCALKANGIDCPPFTNIELMQEYAESAKNEKYDKKRNEIILDQSSKIIQI